MAYQRFFLNENLHRVIHVNRSKNEMVAFDFVEGAFKQYPNSEVQKRKSPAFSIKKVAEIFNRHPKSIHRYIADKNIPVPQREYDIRTKKPGAYFFSDKDLFGLQEYLSQVAPGKTAKSGHVKPQRVPSREDLRALVEYGKILYVKQDDEFIPVWKARDW